MSIKKGVSGCGQTFSTVIVVYFEGSLKCTPLERN